MPRVKIKTKSPRETKRPYMCERCKLAHERDGDNSIRPGETYYVWEPRHGGPRRQHTACGAPRPTQLSSRKTAAVEEAQEDAAETIAAWAPELDLEAARADATLEIDTGELTAALESVAEAARDAGGEYEEGAGNMPESLQYGSQAEAMRDVASRLDDWASDLESWAPSPDTSIEVPADYTGAEGERQELLDAWATALDELREDAQSHLDADSVPEYEG